MNKTKSRIFSAIAAGSLLFSSITPAAFAGDYNFEISGNGSHSDSDIKVRNNRDTDIFQTNNADIVNDIVINSNTGGNKLKDNTGGDVDVQTGDADIQAVVHNQVNSNVAVVDPCDCDGDIHGTIHGNGTDSDNDIKIKKKQDTTITQYNDTWIDNWLDLSGDTGNNKVKDNTGGDISVDTGDVTIAPVEVTNLAGSNVALVGGGQDGGSHMDLDISGNGSHSDNDIRVRSKTDTDFFQTNSTAIHNALDLYGNTGNNKVKDNTLSWGGSLWLRTGDSDIAAYVDNAAGFNAATSDCGCLLGVNGSIEHNGTDSYNDIKIKNKDDLDSVQDNADWFATWAAVNGDTGRNKAKDNTNGDLDVHTGDSSSVVLDSNSGGINIFGDVEVELPWGWSFWL